MVDVGVEVISAIAGITILEGIALATGTDGTTLSAAIAVIAALAGYRYGALTVKEAIAAA